MAAPNGQTLSPKPELAQEPSMEDILASIRRIIASDQTVGHGRAFLSPAKPVASVAEAPARSADSTPAGAAAGEAADPVGASLSEESFADFPGLQDLDALVSPPATIPDASESHEAQTDVAHRDSRPVIAATVRPGNERQLPAEDVFDLEVADRIDAGLGSEPLLSSSSGLSVTSSFQALTDNLLLRDPEMIERLAREALRPMLKTWLDENLPSMVERLVRAEIERVARGGRGRD